MIKEVLTYPKDKEILTQKSNNVENIDSQEIQNLIQDLIDTVKATNGAGISAIQLGKPYKICVINWGGIHVLINPIITRSRGEHTMREGCLSVPGLYVENTRPQKVWISALNEKGEQIEYAEGGNGSYIALHELDHFEGKCAVFEAYDRYAAMVQEKTNEAKKQLTEKLGEMEIGLNEQN